MNLKIFKENNDQMLALIHESILLLDKQKSYVVSLSRYEDAAILRGAEKAFLEIQDKLENLHLVDYC